MKKIIFQDGAVVPALGQGTWLMGEDPSRHRYEVAALRLGLDLGMTAIDTAEIYADGGAERVVGEAVKGMRGQAFLISKVYPGNASLNGAVFACERSLQRLGTDYLDLYLLHWRGSYPLEETVEAFELLQQQGKILRWGVSNFDLGDMQQLPAGCAANQVLYNPEARGIEFDLLPWQQQQNIPLIAYCPAGRGARLLEDPALLDVARRHGASTAQVALAWNLRQPGVLAIPKAVNPDHVRQNAKAGQLVLSAEDLALIDHSFKPPRRKYPLEMV